MRDALIFVGLSILILLAYMGWKLRDVNWREYFSTREGLGILRGIILAPAAILIIGFVLWLILPAKAHAGTWFNDASVFVGLDYTNKSSPQCERNSVDDRGTSNLGARLNIWESNSRGFASIPNTRTAPALWAQMIASTARLA